MNLHHIPIVGLNVVMDALEWASLKHLDSCHHNNKAYELLIHAYSR